MAKASYVKSDVLGAKDYPRRTSLLIRYVISNTQLRKMLRIYFPFFRASNIDDLCFTIFYKYLYILCLLLGSCYCCVASVQCGPNSKVFNRNISL